MASSSHTTSPQPDFWNQDDELRGVLRHIWGTEVGKPVNKDQLAAKLAGLPSRAVAELCLLAFLSDGHQAIPASSVRPLDGSKDEEYTQTIRLLAEHGLLDAYRDDDDKLCLGFGRYLDPTKSNCFKISELPDLIVRWTLDTKSSSDTFNYVLHTLEDRKGRKTIRDANQFPRYATLARLMKVFTDLEKAGAKLDEPRMGVRTSTCVAFGKMLLSRAAEVKDHRTAWLFEFVGKHILDLLFKEEQRVYGEVKTLRPEHNVWKQARDELLAECQKFTESPEKFLRSPE
ncbi:hypothetical protein CONLIGDRAFT_641519 [Coniochaeta ligniaria NRRL 30616]|uniref:Uncharacterized protein n=1 Tax=Coniochaeta ligniaria NRRL 30616 TaxID=1408157 RepID=A0A1J7JP97_9PEZI|nr:hypothetical protein CONLIGDRAFT_641519 [Coniochaeta ligniaria NRRL 30616]